MAVSDAAVPETIEGMRRQNSALRSLNASLESQIAFHREKALEYWRAIQTLESEREANAILTEEIERLREATTK